MSSGLSITTEEGAMAADIARRVAASGRPCRIGAIVTALAQTVRRVALAIKHRRDLAQLTDRDDRLLADIGLKHGDLAAARSAPLWQDPTAILNACVSGRRPSSTKHFHQEHERRLLDAQYRPHRHPDIDDETDRDGSVKAGGAEEQPSSSWPLPMQFPLRRRHGSQTGIPLRRRRKRRSPAGRDGECMRFLS
jgi:uncharacterized protein YjiS (DUF1127 family)